MGTKGKEYVLESARLRALGAYDEAISVIEENINEIDPDVHLVAWLEAFRAAKEKGDKQLAIRFANLVAREDPEVPTIKSFLSAN